MVPFHSHDKHPEYVIYAGIVFTVLTQFYLHEWEHNAPAHLVSLAQDEILQEVDQQIVVINRILADDINYGIDSHVECAVLKTINGIEIKNLKHLAQLIDQISNTEVYIRFETRSNIIIVIECKQAKQSETKILKQNSIVHARSEKNEH